MRKLLNRIQGNNIQLLKSLCIFALFWANAGICLADTPVLFFSDLTSAPNSGWNGSTSKGAAVTVWGLNLGSSGSLSCGGRVLQSSNMEQIPEWGANDHSARLDSRNTLKRITFWLDSSMNVGATSIRVNVAGVESNALAFTIRSTGSIFFVDSIYGNDSNNGSRDTSQGGGNGPFKSLTGADFEENSNIGPGDVIYIREGADYNTLDSEGAQLLSEGRIDGTASEPIAYVGYPTEWPTFDFSSYHIFKSDNDSSDTRTDYLTFAKLSCRGNSAGAFFVWSNGFRVVGCDFSLNKHTSRYTYLIRQVGSGFEYLGNKITGGGYDDYGHHWYIQAQVNVPGSGTNTDGTFAYNEITGFDPDGAPGDTGSSILNFRPNDTSGILFGPFYVHNNYVHNNPGAQFIYYDNEGSSGSVYQPCYIYNNLLHDNMTENIDNSIFCFLRCTSFYLYNNTFYNCESDGGNGGALIHVNNYGPVVSHLISKNNIFSKSSSGDYYFVNTPGTGCTVSSSNDIYYGGTPKTDTDIVYINRIEENPRFTNAAGGDFTLGSGSSALNAGTSAVSGVLTNDIIGIIRADGSYDIGAYESNGGSGGEPGTNPPALPTGLEVAPPSEPPS